MPVLHHFSASSFLPELKWKKPHLSYMGSLQYGCIQDHNSNKRLDIALQNGNTQLAISLHICFVLLVAIYWLSNIFFFKKEISEHQIWPPGLIEGEESIHLQRAIKIWQLHVSCLSWSLIHLCDSCWALKQQDRPLTCRKLPHNSKLSPLARESLSPDSLSAIKIF